MAKRSENARDEQGTWDIGGGSIEVGEMISTTIEREVQEEYGTHVQEIEHLGFRELHRQHEGQASHWIALDFKVRVNPDEVHVNEPTKFDAIDWFTQDTIPEPLHSQLPLFFEKYDDRLFEKTVSA